MQIEVAIIGFNRSMSTGIHGSLVGCEGLEPHLLHRPHVDSIDLDPQPY